MPIHILKRFIKPFGKTLNNANILTHPLNMIGVISLYIFRNNPLPVSGIKPYKTFQLKSVTQDQRNVPIVPTVLKKVHLVVHT